METTILSYEPRSCSNATELETCVNGGIARRECASVGAGFSCQSRQGVDYCGLATECEMGRDATCDGTSVVFCNAGRVDQIDCTALGFDGCNPTYGVCSPSPWN